jgi:mannan endo-1,4-beta-mannosidase
MEPAARDEGSKRFFLKKEAKTFCSLAYTLRQRIRQVTTVFWFFFSKKNCFLCLLALSTPAQAQDAPDALPAPDAMAIQPDPSDFTSHTDAILMSQGNPRRFAGIGVSWLGLIQEGGAPPRPTTHYEVRDILATIQALSSAYTRAVSLGVSAGCQACLVTADGKINPAALSHMDIVLRQARDAGIRIIVPLAGGEAACPANGAPDPVHATACVFARFHHLDAPAFYTDPGIRAEFAADVTKLVNHLNPMTGLAYKNDPTIMAWENCDGCGAGIDPKILSDWTEFIGRTIKAADTRHLYENGAFAGRLGKGGVPVALATGPSVDIVGDRVMPGMDADGAGLASAVNAVTDAGRVFMIDAYGWTPAQWATLDDLQAFYKAIIKNRSISGAFLAELAGHEDGGGYLPAGITPTPPLYFPGADSPAADLATMQPRARAVRRFAFGMNDMLTLPFVNVGMPQVISADHGRVTWRGAAGAVNYSIERSPDISVGGSWTTLCDKCVTDEHPEWQDPSPPASPQYYRMLPFNANDHSGMYSDPLKGK